MKVLVTGSNGFVGQAVVPYLMTKGVDVVGVERRSRKTSFPCHVVPDFERANWDQILEGVDVVVHLAARAHQMGEPKNAVTDQLYFSANRDATLILADMSEKKGVSSFIFISSIAADPFDPRLSFNEKARNRWGTYGLSKWQAEEGLLARQGKMRVSIVRPPLIYGPGVKGNMAKVIKLALKPYPLPFGCFKDKKSFLFVDNLADAIYQLILHRPFQDAVFTVKDSDLSLAEIITTLREAQGRKPNMIPVPLFFFKLLLLLLGRREMAAKLFGEQIVFDTKFSQLLKWTPPFTYKEGFKKMLDSCIVSSNIEKGM